MKTLLLVALAALLVGTPVAAAAPEPNEPCTWWEPGDLIMGLGWMFDWTNRPYDELAECRGQLPP